MFEGLLGRGKGKNVPVCNLIVKRFKGYPDMLHIYGDATEQLVGEFTLHSNGLLMRGTTWGFHAKTAEVTYENPNIRMDTERVLPFDIHKGNLFIRGAVGIYPHFTLEGFYSDRNLELEDISEDSVREKVHELTSELNRHWRRDLRDKYTLDPTFHTDYGKEKLDHWESEYRKFISDQ